MYNGYVLGLRKDWGGNPDRVLIMTGDRTPVVKRPLSIYEAYKLPTHSPGARGLSGPNFLANSKPIVASKRLSDTVGEPDYFSHIY